MTIWQALADTWHYDRAAFWENVALILALLLIVVILTAGAGWLAWSRYGPG